MFCFSSIWTVKFWLSISSCRLLSLLRANSDVIIGQRCHKFKRKPLMREREPSFWPTLCGVLHGLFGQTAAARSVERRGSHRPTQTECVAKGGVGACLGWLKGGECSVAFLGRGKTRPQRKTQHYVLILNSEGIKIMSKKSVILYFWNFIINILLL